MITNIPLWVEIVFVLTSLFTVILFFILNGRPGRLLVFILLYGSLQSVLAYAGFYQIEGFPPRSIFILIPTFLFIIYGLTGKRLAWVMNSRNLKYSYFLHVIRIPVEIVLFQLYVAGSIPLLMTFEGRNFDIGIGIIAPLIGFLFLRNRIGLKSMIIWNSVGLAFVLFIVGNAVLSIEAPFQLFAFDQPNEAINYFPFVLLPSVIVPIVIYTHLSDIILLKRRIKEG